MRCSLLLSLVLMGGCSAGKGGASGGGAESPDSDGDGSLDYLDCAPYDETVFPGAAEVCDARDNDCDLTVDEDAKDGLTWYADDDDDAYGVDAYPLVACTAPEGYAARGGDCDDGDPDTSPGQPEVCGGGDEDCDGETDEADALDQDTFHPDNDGDTYGAPDVAVTGCELPDGFVKNDDDCDDQDAEVRPHATELCDGVDQDCDSRVDDSATDLTFYVDADHDGYGGTRSTTSCELGVAGYALNSEDCDDGSEVSWPGAEELCDGEDNDCDGVIDDEIDEMPTWHADGDGDGYGDPDGPTYTACVTPDGYVDDARDCDDTDPEVSPLGLERCEGGVDEDCDGLTDPCAPATLSGATSGDYLGWALLGGEDWSGDGLPDALWSAYLANPAGSDSGRIYLSGAALTADLDLAGAAALDGTRGLELGAGLADPGDLNGDGYPELLVGGTGEATAGEDAGSVWLVAGPLVAGADLSGALAVVRGATAGDGLGRALGAGGDVDGDGVADWAAGAEASGRLAAGAGAVWVYSGAWTGDEAAGGSALALVLGEAEGDSAGRAVDLDGDLDGDGVADLVVGASGVDGDGDATNSGRIYAVFGPVSGELSLADADASVLGEEGSQAGYALDAAGDLDGDGLADVLVGARHDGRGGDEAGAVALLLGPVTVTSLTEAAMTWTGDSEGDDAGSAVRAVGDLNGDGAEDLAFGGPGDGDAGADAGAVWLVYGPAMAGEVGFKLSGEIAGGALGLSLGGAGDLDGDGLDDLLAGAPKASSTASKSGSILFVSGF